MSRMKEVNLTFSYFLFNLFSFILFLELGLGLEGLDHAVTQQVTSYDMVTKSHDIWKDVKGSERIMSYNM